MSRLMSMLGLIMIAGALSACAVAPVERIEFPSDEYAMLAKEGTGVVRGQAFLKTRGGDVKVAAGEEVLLNPVTSYSEQWYEVAYLGGKTLTAPDPRYHDHIEKTIADGDGRFVFRSVPPGEYFVTARVVWEAATGYGGGLQAQGGFVTKRIRVSEGEQVDVIITR